MSGVAADMLFRRGWLPQQAHAAVVLVHGLGEHSGRYEHVGRWLAARGFGVHAFDHLGHGLSTGRRAHVDRFDQYLDDLACVVEAIAEEHPALPTFLVGHSMGGLIAACFVRERRPDLAGVALSAPALGTPSASKWRVIAARVLRALWPLARLPGGIDPAALSSDPLVARAYVSDPLVETRISAALVCELFRRMERCGAGGADVALPLLVMHGDADRICSIEASEAFAAAAPQARFLRYPGLRHEIFNEPSGESLLADLASWMDEVLEGRGLSTGRGA